MGNCFNSDSFEPSNREGISASIRLRENKKTGQVEEFIAGQQDRQEDFFFEV
jgi:hypothetical protein